MQVQVHSSDLVFTLALTATSCAGSSGTGSGSGGQGYGAAGMIPGTEANREKKMDQGQYGECCTVASLNPRLQGIACLPAAAARLLQPATVLQDWSQLPCGPAGASIMQVQVHSSDVVFTLALTLTSCAGSSGTGSGSGGQGYGAAGMIPGTEANREKKMDQGTGTGTGTHSPACSPALHTAVSDSCCIRAPYAVCLQVCIL